MPHELQLATGVSGAVAYAILRNDVGQPYNAATLAFENYVTANLGNYVVSLAEQGAASRYYAGDMPALAAGVYAIAFYQRVGADVAETDTLLGHTFLQWSGSAVLPLASVSSALTSLSGRIPAALVSGRIDANVGDLAGSALLTLADSILDRAGGVEVGFTLRESLRLILAALAGKLSGAATTTVTIRAANDLKPRITATVDADGNRSSLVLDAS
jgi:hypothetical protein